MPAPKFWPISGQTRSLSAVAANKGIGPGSSHPRTAGCVRRITDLSHSAWRQRSQADYKEANQLESSFSSSLRECQAARLAPTFEPPRSAGARPSPKAAESLNRQCPVPRAGVLGHDRPAWNGLAQTPARARSAVGAEADPDFQALEGPVDADPPKPRAAFDVTRLHAAQLRIIVLLRSVKPKSIATSPASALSRASGRKRVQEALEIIGVEHGIVCASIAVRTHVCGGKLIEEALKVVGA